MRTLRLIVPLLAVAALAAGALTLSDSVGADGVIVKPPLNCNPSCFVIVCPTGCTAACVCDQNGENCGCRCLCTPIGPF